MHDDFIHFHFFINNYNSLISNTYQFHSSFSSTSELRRLRLSQLLKSKFLAFRIEYLFFSI